MEKCNYCGSVLKKADVREILGKVTFLIDNDQLNVKSRSQIKCHKRYYLFAKMREHGFSLQEIGDHFKRNHSTVIHGIKMNYLYLEQQDPRYLNDTEEYDNLFQNNQ